MRPNPLNVQFWLWGQDVLAGYLEAFGFRRYPNASGKGSSLYRKGPIGLHSSTAWLGVAQGVLVYKRPVESFFLLEDDQSMPLLPEQARPVDRGWGLEVLRSFVVDYETWVWLYAGPAYRKMLLENSPSMLRRDRAAWERWALPDDGR